MKSTKEKSNTQNQNYKIYYKTKQIAKILEEDNNSRLILFPSANGAKDEWLKLGGNSALFYKYLIAPRLNKKSPTVRPDTDLEHRFKDGVISIHWKNLFLENLAKIGLTSIAEENGLLIIKLGHKFSLAEIKKLKSREKEMESEVAQLLKPKNTAPELYHHLLALAKALPPKVAKLKEPYRSDFGSQINRAISELFITYLDFVNHNLPQETAKDALLNSTNRINALLIILNENKLLDHSTISSTGRIITELRTNIEKVM